MTFTVVWSAHANQDFAAILGSADDPAAVRAAAARVDDMRRRMARDLGESRAPEFRLWYEDDLGVFYHIDEGALRVKVLFVGPARRR